MPESVTDRPTRSHEYIFMLTKAARYYWDAEAVRETGQEWTGQPGHLPARMARIRSMTFLGKLTMGIVQNVTTAFPQAAQIRDVIEWRPQPLARLTLPLARGDTGEADSGGD